jgi:DNA invertase Pin-like site-specific DNA recombinase
MVLDKDSEPDKFMMWDFNVVGARSYILQLKKNTMRGMKQKIKDGETICKAPIGYLNCEGDGKTKRGVCIDPERAPLVIKMFEVYATGVYTIDAIADLMKREGLRTNKGNIISR